MSSSNATEPFAKGSTAPFVKSPYSRMPSTSVTIKGLPPNHPRAYCMGEYTKTECVLHDRSVYFGGRDGDLALSFNGKGHWAVRIKADVGGEGFAIIVRDSAATPDRIVSPWLIDVDKQPDPSVRDNLGSHWTISAARSSTLHGPLHKAGSHARQEALVQGRA
jgi:hypothetical protein